MIEGEDAAVVALPPMRSARGRLSRPAALFILACSTLFAYNTAWNGALSASGIDFYQFWVVGLGLREAGATRIYSDDVRATLGPKVLSLAEDGARVRVAAATRRHLETYSTPFLYGLFALGASSHYERDYLLFQEVSMAAFLLGLLGLFRLLGYGLLAPPVVLILVLEWYEPLISDVAVANVSRLQVAALALLVAVLLRAAPGRRALGAGLLLGAATLFKPNLATVPLVLALGWVVRRRWKDLGRSALGFAVSASAAVTLGAAAFGSFACWRDWFRAVALLPDSIVPVKLGNYGPARLLFEGTGVEASAPLAVALLAIIALRVGSSPAPPVGSEEERLDDALLVGVGSLAYLLSARLVWMHYYLFVLPVVLLASRPSAKGVPRLLAAFGAVAMATRPILNLIRQNGYPQEGVLLNLGVVALFVAGLWEMGPERAADTAPAA